MNDVAVAFGLCYCLLFDLKMLVVVCGMWLSGICVCWGLSAGVFISFIELCIVSL